MKNIVYRVFIFLLCFLVFTAGILVALSFYYKKEVPLNTWINGIYCTGKSLEEINTELLEKETKDEVLIKNLLPDKNIILYIPSDEVALVPDYKPSIEACLTEKKCHSWTELIHNKISYSVMPASYQIDVNRLTAFFHQIPEVQNISIQEKDLNLTLTYDSEEGYVFTDEKKHRLSEEKVINYIVDCLKIGITEIDCADLDCYEDVPETEKETELRKLKDKLDQYCKTHELVIDTGDSLLIDDKQLQKFLCKQENELPVVDETGKFVIDESVVAAWVETFGEEYNTINTIKNFVTHKGENKSVTYKTYGTEVDLKYLFEALTSILRDETENPGILELQYKKEGFVRGKDDIGNTYVEIDMGNQHLYYYLNGAVRTETDIVTGNLSWNCDTPEGIYYINNKARNVYLRGADYVSFVKCWVPVYQGIGIHDASWRKQFGGDIYQKNGSHGCINTPQDWMLDFYQMIEVGTPVIMYY